MNPLAVKTFECLNCEHDIEVDYEESPAKVTCLNCNKPFGVDYDAEWDGQRTVDLTKLYELEQ